MTHQLTTVRHILCQGVTKIHERSKQEESLLTYLDRQTTVHWYKSISTSPKAPWIQLQKQDVIQLFYITVTLLIHILINSFLNVTWSRYHWKYISTEFWYKNSNKFDTQHKEVCYDYETALHILPSFCHAHSLNILAFNYSAVWVTKL